MFSKTAGLLLAVTCASRASAQSVVISDAGVSSAPLSVSQLAGLDAGGGLAPLPLPPDDDLSAPTMGTVPSLGFKAAATRPSLVEEAVTVTVRASSRADQVRQSSQAVTVIDTERARRGSADLGELLARTEGISIQRSGGLGSSMRFSLAGFEGEQVRFFLDGVPLALSGYPFGLENVPVNLIERIEIYRGVVPIRFGADALGGAVQLVSRRVAPGTHGSASYQVGAFDTHRLTLQLSKLDQDSGLYATATGYFDRSKNDYPIDVTVTDAQGKERRVRAHRFHDAYASEGAVLELGAIDRSWAEKLSLRTFFSRQARDLQSDLGMFNAYGEPTTGWLTAGSTLTYKQTLLERATLELIGNYAYQERSIRDRGTCDYNWLGQCMTPLREPGELPNLSAGEPYLYSHAAVLRANLTVPFGRHHGIALSLSPTYDRRHGEDRRPPHPGRDPLDVQQNLLTLSSGLAYQLHALEERLEAEAFVKEYTQVVRAEQSVPLGIEKLHRKANHVGAGTTTRYAWTEWLLTKGSYEWATRMPTADELLGDGIGTSDNLGLEPEVSHNLNLELTLHKQTPEAGDYLLELVGFHRRPEDMIVRMSAGGVVSQHVNVSKSTVLGAQTHARWISPGNYLTLDGNLTYQDVRNESETGPFARYRGDRVPNRPYLFGTASARLELSDVLAPRDQIWLSFTTRCTGEFDTSWASAGLNRFVVPQQVLHFAALTYLARGRGRKNLSTTLEVQNLTDAKAFDFFGAQRPGRAVFLKLVTEL